MQNGGSFCANAVGRWTSQTHWPRHCPSVRENRLTFAVNEERLLLSVDDMFFHFGDVMTHVVNQMHVQIVGSLVEHLGERLTSCVEGVKKV